jgi:hypothetical protein
MHPRSHQTVHLKRGAHRSPEHGVCVMELASMLAGERFTDRPRSVCPVIAGYLRALNDALSDAERRALIPYASSAVGTATDAGTRQRRLEWCRRELEAIDIRRSWIRRMVAPLPAVPSPSAAGMVLEHFGADVFAALHRGARQWRPRALALADELLAIRPARLPARGRRDGRRPAPA